MYLIVIFISYFHIQHSAKQITLPKYYFFDYNMEQFE